MNQMEIFKNPEFGSVRVIDEDGKYLFCGTDVARALGYSIPSKAVNTHCKGVSKMEAPTSGGVQKLLFIPEGDVYRLIVHSKLPSAERFERWVFDEVLPSIRQHGAYLTREKLWEVATSPEALLKLCSDLLAEREKNAALQADNARLQGKAVYWSWYGFNSRVEWCACFVSWCYGQMGLSEPRFAACQSQGIPWFQSHGQWGGRDYANIAPGDAIFFDWDLDGSADHVGIVVGTDGSRVYTVEGNSGDACKIKSYSLTYECIKGYGLMNW